MNSVKQVKPENQKMIFGMRVDKRKTAPRNLGRFPLRFYASSVLTSFARRDL